MARGFSAYASPMAEYEFKVILNKQIDRINILFSEKIDGRSANPMREKQMQVDAKINAMDALEAMLRYYTESTIPLAKKFQYKRLEIESKYKNFGGKFKEEKDMNRIIRMEEYVEERYALIMWFLGKKGWLIEDVGEVDVESGDVGGTDKVEDAPEVNSNVT